MAAYLVGEEGPLASLVIHFEEGEEWVLGRDPDTADVVLEDPMVSRKHAICRHTAEGYVFENLSAVNPATQNGRIVTEPVLLREGDILQVGGTFFRFTETAPVSKEEVEVTPEPEGEELETLSVAPPMPGRWILKVVSGPNAGAEFSLEPGKSYVIGKDPTLCDILFQDLSVSRQHARLTVEEDESVFVEDLKSKNGVIVNGVLAEGRVQLSSQDLIGLGTTSFLLIDKTQLRETIVSPPHLITAPAPAMAGEAAAVAAAPPRDWKEIVIPYRHLIGAGIFALLLILLFTGLFALFTTEPIAVKEKETPRQIEETIHGFPDVQFSYTESTGKLFIVGHVLTNIEKQELLYKLQALSGIQDIEDNVVVDSYVWENMNDLLQSRTEWQGVSIHSPQPGRFVVRGYVMSSEQGQALTDFLSRNFPYLDRLEMQVVVESVLNTEIQQLLLQRGFGNISYQLTDGELILVGRVGEDQAHNYAQFVDQMKALPGIRSVKNLVVLTTASTARIDLTEKYQVSGYSTRDHSGYFVVINGKILGKGDVLDGMLITDIASSMILLEKDGLKFQINYNPQ